MKKKITMLTLLMLAAALAGGSYYCVGLRRIKAQEAYLETHYIFDRTFRNVRNLAASSANPYLAGGVVTPLAQNLFLRVDQDFPIELISNLTDHYAAVRRHFNSRFPEPEAECLFDVYQKYLTCQIKLFNDSAYQVNTTDLRRLLSLLYRVQQLRREMMGKETADALFGPDVKEKEYFLRREMIIADPGLYGPEKEQRLNQIRTEMWEKGEAIPIGEDDNAYNRYRFKLKLYEKDLLKLEEKDRRLRIVAFREEFFTAEQIRQLHEAENQMARESKNIKRYREAENRILNDPAITPVERNRIIGDLQETYFKSEAQAFRRTEAIRKGLAEGHAPATP